MKAVKELLTVEKVKEKYHSPIPFRDRFLYGMRACTYCVGGALMKYLRDINLISSSENFPLPTSLIMALSSIRPLKYSYTYNELTYALIMANDTGDFDKAWEYVDKILKQLIEL